MCFALLIVIPFVLSNDGSPRPVSSSATRILLACGGKELSSALLQSRPVSAPYYLGAAVSALRRPALGAAHPEWLIT